MVGERINKVEDLTKTSLGEVNTFLHTIHSDFETFLAKHKREHVNLNMRVARLSEDVSHVVDAIRATRRAVEAQATVVTCLVEFNSIEHALAL